MHASLLARAAALETRAPVKSCTFLRPSALERKRGNGPQLPERPSTAGDLAEVTGVGNERRHKRRLGSPGAAAAASSSPSAAATRVSESRSSLLLLLLATHGSYFSGWNPVFHLAGEQKSGLGRDWEEERMFGPTPGGDRELLPLVQLQGSFRPSTFQPAELRRADVCFCFHLFSHHSALDEGEGGGGLVQRHGRAATATFYHPNQNYYYYFSEVLLLSSSS